MPHAGAIAVVLLAAGTGRRFGALKQLQLLDGQTLVHRAALAAVATGHPVHVVTGAEVERVQQALQGLPVHFLHNADWASGMGHSLALAARSIAAQSPPPQALLILLADQPLVDAAALHSLLQEHHAHPDFIIAADHGATLGPPCLFPARYLSALSALEGDRGARGLIQQHAADVRTVKMPAAALDVDTPEDLARAAARLRPHGA